MKENHETSRFAGAVRGRRGKLRFAGALEQEFRAAHLARARQRTRLWQTLELFVAPAFVWVHYRTRVDSAADFEVLTCAAIGMAVSITLFVLARYRYDLRHYLRAAIWLTPLRSVAYAVIIANFVDLSGTGTAVLTASTFGHFFFSGLLYHHALVAALSMLASYLAALLWHEVPLGIVEYSVLIVGAVQTMATVVAYDAQFAARVAFVEHGTAASAAAHDGLTGLRNRRDFDERLEAFWDQAMAREEPLTVLMLDVDNFKAYNDRYGHQAGDDVLRRVAGAMRLAARGSDVVARYGGEEFVMLAQGLDEPAAVSLAERIRFAVEQLAIAHEDSDCARVITASIGIAHVVPRPGRTAEGALQLADENLYHAKRQGRNVYIATGADYGSLSTGRFRHKS